MYLRNFLLRGSLLAGTLVSGLLAPQLSAQDRRPTAPELLPPHTLAVIRIPDMPLLVERFKNTAIGQIGQDPRMKPLVGQLFQSAQEAFKQVEGEVGLPLSQILRLPQGEVCVAFVAPPELELEAGVVVLIDTKNEVEQARKLVAAAEEIATRRGGGKGRERFGNSEIAVFTGLGPQPVYAIEQEGTFIFCSSKPLMETVVANLTGAGVEKTLADSEKFITVMNRCVGEGEEQPHLLWYTDPIALVRRLASGSLAATGLALFPVLGLDGLQAVGGTMTFATHEYDETQHVHMLLDNPRYGVIDAIALGSGDMTPESWAPVDCVSYSTLRWDVMHTLRVSARLVDSIMGEGAMDEQVRRRLSDPLGVDFLQEVVPHLTGRATHIQWVEKPVRLNSMATIVGIELKDAQAFKPVLEKIVQRHGASLTKQRFGQFEYWSGKEIRPRQRSRGDNIPQLRIPVPCVGIIGESVIIADSMKAYEEAIRAQTNQENSLAGSLGFKLVASKIRRQHGGNTPGALQFSRPEEGLRFWYELATADATRQRLAQRAERNAFFGSVQQALKDHPLPPFEVLSEYLAPGGGMLINDETGIHYMTFTLKRN